MAGTPAARSSPVPAEVFATVVEEVGRLLGTDLAHMVRFEPDETVTTVAGWSREGDHQPVGWRSPIKATDLSRVVVRTGRPPGSTATPRFLLPGSKRNPG